MVEIELKFRVDDPAALRARLVAAGGQMHGHQLESNRIYDTPDGALRRRDCGLRIRIATPLDPSTATAAARGHSAATLTFKGPREPGAAKRRVEHETPIDKPEAIRAILRGLGYIESVSFERCREYWRVGECEVALDELPRLGWFCEVEGPSEAAVQTCAAALQLAQLVNETYVELAAAAGAPRADGARELRFPPPP